MENGHKHLLDIKQAVMEGKGFQSVKKMNGLLCTF